MQSKGFEAYLVGGCVRDLLVGADPKDFDIATSARPQQVKRAFPRNCRIIGRRFKLAHLHFNRNQKILEVATFRTSPVTEQGEDGDLLITHDNEFGTAEEDALRRDFTVNALFMDPIGDCIIDFVGGMEDVQNRLLRTIGEPVVRFREDPVRIVRAAKFAGRLGFEIEPATYEAMAEVAPDLSRAAPPRMFEEILRLLRGGHSLESFQILRDIGALKVILPVVAEFLNAAPEPDRVRFWRTLEALDHEILSGRQFSNALLLGCLFESPVRHRAQAEHRRSWTSVAENTIGPFARELRLPRRDAGGLKRICGVQQRFTIQGPKRFSTASFLRDIYFKEALELFELTCTASGEGFDDLHRWQQLADGSDEDEVEPAEAASELDAMNREAASESDEPTEADRSEGDETPRDRPRRRRRRGGRGRGSRDRAESDGGEEVAETPGDDDAATTDAPNDTASDETTSDGAATDGRRPRRRRRSRKKATSTAEGKSEGDDDASNKAPARRSRSKKKTAGDKAPASQASGRKKSRKRSDERGRGGRRNRSSRSRRPEHDDSVDVLEPEAIDVSAFDVELAPRQVPSFGVIVEGSDSKGKKKARAPKLPVDENDSYKPPPPPGPEDPAPPPPPPDDGEFGDW